MRRGFKANARLRNSVIDIELLRRRSQFLDNLEDSLISQEKNEEILVEGSIEICHISPKTDLTCSKFDEDFQKIAVGNSNGSISLLTVEHLKPLVTYEAFPKTATGISCSDIQRRPLGIDHPRTNSFISSYDNGLVNCWNHLYNKSIYSLQEQRQVLGVTYHPHLPKILTYGDDGVIILYDEETRRLERIFTISEPSKIHDAVFHPQNSWEFISGGCNSTVYYWDIREASSTRQIHNLHIRGKGLDFNPQGTQILVACWQDLSPLQILSYGQGECLNILQPDEYFCKLFCGKYLGKNFIITGGEEPNFLRIIDCSTYLSVAYLNMLPGPVTSLDLGPTKDCSTHITFISDSRLHHITFSS